jgi:hypothetical protein
LGALSLFLIAASTIAIPATAADGDPSIASDKLDYFPGETVSLSGSGWSGDATANIVVDDNVNRSWQRNVDVDVDADGNIRDAG